MATPIPSNRCEFMLSEAATAVDGAWSGEERTTTSVSIDTRSLRPGALFLALQGTSDGHIHLTEAAKLGAAAAIVERGRAVDSLPCIEVGDTQAALGNLAARHLERIRAARAAPCIAIGGAAGKTTTKELVAAASRAIFGPTLSTVGNLNNLIGVPMTIFGIEDTHRAIVLECATNTRGEIPRLARMVKPDVALVLNVDIEHSEGLGSLDEIADEETALFSTSLRFAVASTEQPLVTARIPAHLSTLTFGVSPAADVRLVSRTMLTSGRSRISIKLNPLLVEPGESPLLVTDISLIGEASASNFVAALAGIIAMGPKRLSGDQLNAIGRVFADAQPVPRRLALTTIGDLTVIDDSYNAQPPSVRAAIAAAREVADGSRARLVLVLGDMLELGGLSHELHREMISAALRARPAILIAVGPEMNAALDALRDYSAAAKVKCISSSDSGKAAALLIDLVHPNDVVLVKGSLGMSMDQVIIALKSA